MTHMYQVPEARVLIGCLFLHYLIYGFLYLVHACKTKKDLESEGIGQNQTELQHQPQMYGQERQAYDQHANAGGELEGGEIQYEGGDGDKKTKVPAEQEVDMENIDVQLEDDGEDESEAPQPAGGANAAAQNTQYNKNQFDSGSSTENVGVIRNPQSVNEIHQREATSSVGLSQQDGTNHSFPAGGSTFQQQNQQRAMGPGLQSQGQMGQPGLEKQSSNYAKQEFNEEDELEEFQLKNFLEIVVKNYQKSMLWFTMLVSLCSMRAANGFTVWLSWICLALRVGQLAAAAVKSEKAAWLVYAAVTIMTVLMFFSEMIIEGADIVHEAEPTDKMKTNVQIFARNYRAPYGNR